MHDANGVGMRAKFVWSVPAATLVVASGLCLGVAAAPPASSPSIAKSAKPAKSAGTTAENPKVDPAAMVVLTGAHNYLSALTAFRVHAITTYDEIVGGDYKLQKTEAVSMTMHRPDQIRADVMGDERAQVIVDDGKKLTIYSKPENMFVSMGALPTARETVALATARYGVHFPLMDLISFANAESTSQQVIAARDVGASPCEQMVCEQIAFRGPSVDWQLWIQRGNQPLVRKMVVTTHDQPTQPQFTATLDWDISGDIGPEDFAFDVPSGATEMALPSGAANAFPGVHVPVTRTVDVDPKSARRFDAWGRPLGREAPMKNPPLGTIVAALPSGCTKVPSGGAVYQRCGDTYYHPIYYGTGVRWVTVLAPK